MGNYSSKCADLTILYNKFTELHDEYKLTLARSLVNQEGKVDLESEGLTTAENQRDMSLQFTWGHNHIFNDTFKVDGKMCDRHIDVMARLYDMYDLPEDYFNGKDVIDVGCWTGGTTLLLKALGANKVLALEEVQKYAKTANVLVSDIYEQENVTCEGMSVYDLVSVEKYDIVYCPGVIYHLSDPIVALRRLFNSLKDGGEIYIESLGCIDDYPVCRYVGNARGEHDRDITQRFGWAYYIPSMKCLERWLNEVGFCDVKCNYIAPEANRYPRSPRVYAYGKRERRVEITRAGLSQPDIL